MDDNEVLDVQETNGENNDGIVTDGLEPEVVDPKDNDNETSGDAGGIVSEDEDEESGDDPVTPPTGDDLEEPKEESSDEAKVNAHKYYCMQMLSVMPGL